MTDTQVAGAPDYGLDAPGMVRGMAALGAALLVAGIALDALRLGGPRWAGAGRSGYWMGASFALTSLAMIASSRIGKLRARDRLLGRLALAGGEVVLDVGCGHGLLLVGAARRLTTGRAIGVDLWSQKDQQDNSAEATLANAAAEGVADRVEVRSGDMRALPLGDRSVDVVVSSLAVHNLPTDADRATAIGEMVRVLVPGGRLALLDIAHVGAYAAELRRLGCVVERVGFSPWIFPPTRELFARRPAG
jgi:arsenite methyltransferase